MQADLVKHYDIALALGELAAALDEYKNTPPLPLKLAATACVGGMHCLAQALLGDDSGAVYAPEDEAEKDWRAQ